MHIQVRLFDKKETNKQIISARVISSWRASTAQRDVVLNKRLTAAMQLQMMTYLFEINIERIEADFEKLFLSSFQFCLINTISAFIAVTATALFFK